MASLNFVGNSDGRKAYLTHCGLGTVTVIDIARITVPGTNPVGTIQAH